MPSVVYSTVSRLTVFSAFILTNFLKQSKRFLVSSGVSSAREEFFLSRSDRFLSARNFSEISGVAINWTFLGDFYAFCVLNFTTEVRK